VCALRCSGTFQAGALIVAGMDTKKLHLSLVALAAATMLAAGCGSVAGSAPSGSGSKPSGSVSLAAPSQPSQPSSPAAGATALQGEAIATAAGDIPDNQVFITYRTRAGFSVQYPEGWSTKGSGTDVTFRDKSNIVHVTVAQGPPPTVSSVTAQIDRLKGHGLISAGRPQTATIGGKPAIQVVYFSKSAQDPVTGKSVILHVDRDYVFSAGRVAVIDLASPKGVDNVDAYRQIAQSFKWH
jgi:hypothetical protein